MAVERRGWRPDPYGVHEQRYFSLDGMPTRLVSDGGKTSSDPPPHGGPDVPVLPASPHGPPPVRRMDSYRGTASPVKRIDVRTGLDPLGHSGRTQTGSIGLVPVEPMAIRAMPPLLAQPTREEVVHHAAAGWYPDPTTPPDLRYWDGAEWTEHSSPATPTDEPAHSPPVVRSRIRTRTSSALVNIGLLLVAGVLIFALVVTGNPRLPSDPESAAQGNTTNTTTTTTLAPRPPTPAAREVAAWSSQYEGNMKDLGTDEESIDVADDELKTSNGGGASHDYSTALSAAQQLSSDVATDQKLPAIPDAVAESAWTTELSDLAVAAGAYFQGFTDSAHGNPTAGAALIQQGVAQVRQAQVRGNNLVSRLSAAESG
jgi:Protein of unknown function (DUF2510)